MRRAQRRGYVLIQLLLLLPIIAAMSTVTYRLAARILRFETVAYRQMEEDTIMRDLVRRIREDAAAATSASEEGNRLRLVLSGCEVTYEAVDGSVTRTEHRDEKAQVFEWEQERVTSSFCVETIADRPAMVWITFTHGLAKQRGPDRVRSLSAAATIGRGGAS